MYLFVPQQVVNTPNHISIHHLVYNPGLVTVTFFILLGQNYNHLTNYYIFVNQ
jgi:hypothetical protein